MQSCLIDTPMDHLEQNSRSTSYVCTLCMYCCHKAHNLALASLAPRPLLSHWPARRSAALANAVHHNCFKRSMICNSELFCCALTGIPPLRIIMSSKNRKQACAYERVYARMQYALINEKMLFTSNISPPPPLARATTITIHLQLPCGRMPPSFVTYRGKYLEFFCWFFLQTSKMTCRNRRGGNCYFVCVRVQRKHYRLISVFVKL